MNGIPAIAFSTQAVSCQEVMERELLPIARRLLKEEIGDHEIWNVNFPGCGLKDYQGIHWNRKVAGAPLYQDAYRRIDKGNGKFSVIKKYQDSGNRYSPGDRPEGCFAELYSNWKGKEPCSGIRIIGEDSL